MTVGTILFLALLAWVFALSVILVITEAERLRANVSRV